MGRFSKEYIKFSKQLSPKLSEIIESKRQSEIEQIIKNVLSFIIYSTDRAGTKIIKNDEDFIKIQHFIILAIDSLRSTLSCQHASSLMGLALLDRTSFENHCNILYMLNHANPALMIDRHFRFHGVLNYKQAKRSPTLKLPSEDFEKIKKHCKEWFNPNGKMIKNPHWTAEPGNNLRKIAKAVGYEDFYIVLYATNSELVHGSPLARNFYLNEQGVMHFFGSAQDCAKMSLSVCYFWTNAIENFLKYFGISFNETDLQIVKENISYGYDADFYNSEK